MTSPDVRAPTAWADIPPDSVYRQMLIGPVVYGAVSVSMKDGRFPPLRSLEKFVQQIAQQVEATELRDPLALRTPRNSVIGFSEGLSHQKFGPLKPVQSGCSRARS